jgi:hypothetical protein
MPEKCCRKRVNCQPGVEAQSPTTPSIRSRPDQESTLLSGDEADRLYEAPDGLPPNTGARIPLDTPEQKQVVAGLTLIFPSNLKWLPGEPRKGREA